MIGGAVACGLAYWHGVRCRTPWESGHLLSGALVWSYLLGPLAQHLLMTPPAYRYISVADNFFASTLAVQIVCFLALGVPAQAVGWLHRRACRHAAPAAAGKQSGSNDEQTMEQTAVCPHRRHTSPARLPVLHTLRAGINCVFGAVIPFDYTEGASRIVGQNLQKRVAFDRKIRMATYVLFIDSAA